MQGEPEAVERELRPLQVVDLGRRDYKSVLALQEQTHAARIRGEIPDTLLLVEHAAVVLGDLE